MSTTQRKVTKEKSPRTPTGRLLFVALATPTYTSNLPVRTVRGQPAARYRTVRLDMENLARQIFAGKMCSLRTKALVCATSSERSALKFSASFGYFSFKEK